MKRVWKPLGVGGLRLYCVHMRFPAHPHWNEQYIVAAQRPMHAAQLVEDIYKDAEWTEETPIFKGEALNVYMPETWWTEGIPGLDEWMQENDRD